MPNPKQAPELVKFMSGELEPALMDPAEIQLAITNRILAAESVEDVLTMAGTLQVDQVLLRPFKIRDVRIQKSAFTESAGPAVFAIIDAHFLDTPDDQTDVLTCGGANVLAQIAALDNLDRSGKVPGALRDTAVKLTRTVRPTARGYHPLWLMAADAPNPSPVTQAA